MAAKGLGPGCWCVVPLFLVMLGAASCASVAPPAVVPTGPSASAEGSPCVRLKVSLTCQNSTLLGQCSVALHNESSQTASVHSDFAVGDQFESPRWRNLYFRVVDVKGFAYRMNARTGPTPELGTSLISLEPRHGFVAQYDVALLHHRIDRLNQVLPLPFGDYKITAYYDVSSIVTRDDQPFCEAVFASNTVESEIMGPNNNMSPLWKPNRLLGAPDSASPIDGTPFVDPGFPDIPD